MIINTNVIAKFYPCYHRFDNFKNFYDNKDFTPKQFLGLKNISQEDKLWVCFRLMNKDLIPLCAADIAELVLPLFEAKYPNDNRPRKAIEAAKSKTMTKEEIKVAGQAAYAAGHATMHAIAHSAAYAAAHASFAAYSPHAESYISYGIRTTGFDDLVNKKIRTIVLKYLNKSSK